MTQLSDSSQGTSVSRMSSRRAIASPIDWFATVALASVWLHQGLACKILRADGHVAIVAQAVGTTAAPPLAALLGSIEVILAGWVLSRRARNAAAITQTILLVGMNAAGLVFAPEHIADPSGMLTANAALIALAWMLACQEARHDCR